ncbi:MAG: bactofilin family protein [Anaerolineae bacterium]
MSFFTGRKQNETDDNPQDTQTTSKVGFDTVLSASTVLEGSLKSEGNIRLDGQFSGKLDITGNILVGETAEIHADIEARNISIAGTVRGNVTGNKVQLLKTGRIWGDIQSNSLTTEEGAFIEGKITMHSIPVHNIDDDSIDITDGDIQPDDNDDIPDMTTDVLDDTLVAHDDDDEGDDKHD